ncbi:subtilisin-like protease isoform X2 [Dioscorea cayenensis subsp. rotundata]|uniref:Subtilisin-like protease isoform X2 n=1 Tax=Dioscorea cayennensis subsp. rotundata TaxID=55577 RepID=A0AB40C2C8_DIOCR|nr:subtilisin-like protease isoform X2 [Dioscorea cayenensis subsp. rotundata]
MVIQPFSQLMLKVMECMWLALRQETLWILWKVLGQALGRAAGMAPKAFISVYKVCWKDKGCVSSNIIAGIDKAIQDGVHILQMSFGGNWLESFEADQIIVATYSAMQKGIISHTTVGNEGPNQGTLGHAAPWDIVVGVTITDRRIRATVTLSNGKQFQGGKWQSTQQHSY